MRQFNLMKSTPTHCCKNSSANNECKLTIRKKKGTDGKPRSHILLNYEKLSSFKINNKTKKFQLWLTKLASFQCRSWEAAVVGGSTTLQYTRGLDSISSHWIKPRSSLIDLTEITEVFQQVRTLFPISFSLPFK